ncbi:sentan [Limosa lapponica baueri]|uniref:Sentan n=1 Tax=Limosa lapponica baueri TaxID=1758121 RepID=A0A2I0TMH0_LIMLA|nr:sentan [Limosa lapponica baueri]
MCGCRASVPSTKQYSVNQPAPAPTKTSPSATAGMPKRVPIAKQLASIKALGKGSDLEKAFATAALVYNNSADHEGKLSKAETKSLLQTQFGGFIRLICSSSDRYGRNFESSICDASLAVLCSCEQRADLVEHVSQLSLLFCGTGKRRSQTS